MKKRRLFTRIIAAILVIVFALGVIIPAVTATEIDDETTPIATQSIQLCNLTDSFDQSVVTVFIGNIETHKVKYVELLKENDYLATTNLEDGYYVVYANEYSWTGADGNAYAVNGGSYVYMYVGDKYDQNPYGVEFLVGNDNLKLEMKAAPDGFNNIKYGGSLTVTTADMQYPEDAKLEKVNDPTDDTKPQNQNENNDKDDVSFFDVILNMVKDSAFLLIALVVCAIAYNVIKIKKRLAAEKQAENDKCDDRHIK